MRPKRESLLLPRLLKRIAPQIGARVFIEPEWGIVGQITFKNGKKSYFRYNTLDLNPVGSSDVAKDKDYATFFMCRLGFPAVPGKAFYSDDWCEAIGSKRNTGAAYRYAK
ncbi:cyanophycin synthetase, partial [Candidatus Kaiserbacteria bacterium]|nr:cyanophycin synthetase [Candidatus Kaiserbacteria bacterium]